MRDKFTILAQGPIRNNLLEESLPYYLKYGKVVICCYQYDDTSKLENTEATIVKIESPSTHNVFNMNNSFLQTYGILQGLKYVDTEFTVRVRCDESFPNLDIFIDNINKHSEKVHVTNLYSFKDREHKYCLGNHIFACKTDLMTKAFQWAHKACIGNIDNVVAGGDKLYYIDSKGVGIPMWSEILQTISFLKAMDVDILAEDSKKTIIDNFYMTPLKDFPDFKWTHKYNNYNPITKDTIMEYDPMWTTSGDAENRFMNSIMDI